jgi:hypothetical protein
MQLTNSTPFPSLAFQATDQLGQISHIVVMRATFDIQTDGTLALSTEQQPIVMTDEYFGEMNKSSIRQESDLVPFKPKCDVIVNATAYAPGGHPSPGFVAGVRINGPLQENGETSPLVLKKNLFVTGPRFWEKGLLGKWTLKTPATAIRLLPIRYEYAFGGECRVELVDPDGKQVKAEFRLSPEQRNCHPDGPETAPIAHTVCELNPLGMGFADGWYLKAKKSKTIPAPQIDDPLQPVSVFGKNNPPQGFGVIAKAWKQRLELAGTYDDAWLETRWPNLPEDFDSSFWNGANPDMQVPFLHGDEEIMLTNLTPSGFLKFRLPGHPPAMKSTSVDGRIQTVPANLDTLIIEPDAMKVNLVWRAAIATIPEIAFIETGDTL